MAALTADVYLTTGANYRQMTLKCVGADTFYKGALVVYDLATGFIQVPQAGDAADEFAGFVVEQTTTTAQGDEVLVQTEGEVLIAYGTTALQADEGDLLFRDLTADSDNPEDLLSATYAASADLAIGRIIRFESATAGGWVRMHDKSATATGA